MPDFKFLTDGCSGGLSYFWKKIYKKPPPWEKLCIIHDSMYYIGGTKNQRLQADVKLLKGVIENGYPYWAIFMFLMVRVGGSPYLPFSWRWGYGYKYPKGYLK